MVSNRVEAVRDRDRLMCLASKNEHDARIVVREANYCAHCPIPGCGPWLDVCNVDATVRERVSRQRAHGAERVRFDDKAQRTPPRNNPASIFEYRWELSRQLCEHLELGRSGAFADFGGEWLG